MMESAYNSFDGAPFPTYPNTHGPLGLGSSLKQWEQLRTLEQERQHFDAQLKKGLTIGGGAPTRPSIPMEMEEIQKFLQELHAQITILSGRLYHVLGSSEEPSMGGEARATADPGSNLLAATLDVKDSVLNALRRLRQLQDSLTV